MTGSSVSRCEWAGSDPLMVAYHDNEWGVPVHDEEELFEFLILEGAQAGLSWSTILNRRETYRKAFAQFDIQKVASFTENDFDRLLKNPGIIRNKLKIRSAINNAQRFIAVQEEFGSFNQYFWQFVNFKPIQNQFQKLNDIPASTDLSVRISKDMKKRGFNFVGPTICYAFMQSVGMVNDHLIDCFRYKEILLLST
ncbi:MAG: DNA-3-methyladenine glycosylase I [Candidatus Heimdallarchaeota archaeon]|nr:MAG: DNA-3-methyladenine glycosylase I [Candidatus Heimdallarchaeota archaeon]